MCLYIFELIFMLPLYSKVTVLITFFTLEILYYKSHDKFIVYYNFFNYSLLAGGLLIIYYLYSMARKRAPKYRASDLNQEKFIKKSSKRSNKDMTENPSFGYKLCKILLYTVFLYSLIPLAIILFPQIIEQVVFLNLLSLPLSWERLHEPFSHHNISHCTHFYLTSDNASYGVWHMLPHSHENLYENNEVSDVDEVEKHLGQAENIILYLHGNGLHRGIRHRINMYKELQKKLPGYHIIAFDYRGFGDSIGWPSEKGLVEDTIMMLRWIKSTINPSTKITIWGHSLGSSISTIATSKLTRDCDKSEDKNACIKPDYIVLEGAFKNLRQAALESPLTKVLFYQDLVEYVLDRALNQYDLHLDTESYFNDIDIPMLLLHAEDDDIIMVEHSNYLFDLCDESYKGSSMSYVRFSNKHQCSHNHIAKSEHFVDVIKKFFNGEIRQKTCTFIEV